MAARRAPKADDKKNRKNTAPATASANSPWAVPISLREALFILKVFLILAAGVWIFLPTLDGTWYGDDDLYLTGNPLMQDPHRIWKAWFQPGSFIEYYPIEETVQWYQWQLWGMSDTFGYRVTNLVLHLASSLLVWRVLAKFSLKFAWLGGLLFAVHPATIDTVAVISELKSTLSLPPFLLAICFWIDYVESKKTSDYILALAAFVTAMLCKVTMAFFPVMILVYAWWRQGRITPRDLVASVPFFAVSVILGFTTVHAGVVYAGTTHYVSPGPIHLGGFFSRLALVGLSYAFYVIHCLFPFPSMPLYPLLPIDPPSAWQFLPWFGILPGFYWLWSKRQTWGRHVLLGLSFFSLGLLPFLGFNQVSYMCLTWVQDHFLYIPVIGIIGLIVAGLEQFRQRLPGDFITLGPALLSLVVLFYGAVGYSYARDFADPERLWTENAYYNPDSWFVRYRLGSIYMGQHRIPEAIEQLELCLKIDPDFYNAYMNLAVALDMEGRSADAISAYQSFLKIKPDNTPAEEYLGNDFYRAGRFSEAAEQFAAVARAFPGDAGAHNQLGCVLIKLGRLREAIAELQTALRIDPDSAQVQGNLAVAQKMEADGNAKKPVAH